MEIITITEQAKLVLSIREFVNSMTGKRRIGLIYYQRLSDGGLIVRALSEDTSKEFLIKGIAERIIYIPVNTIIAQNT